MGDSMTRRTSHKIMRAGSAPAKPALRYPPEAPVRMSVST
jgi:hypothetical protein